MYREQQQLSVREGGVRRDCEGGPGQVAQHEAGRARRLPERLHIRINIHEEAGNGPPHVSLLLA